MLSHCEIYRVGTLIGESPLRPILAYFWSEFEAEYEMQKDADGLFEL